MWHKEKVLETGGDGCVCGSRGETAEEKVEPVVSPRLQNSHDKF